MQNLLHSLVFLWGVFFSPWPVFASMDEPVDYLKLTHGIDVKLLRAGNHDLEGVNVYYFKVIMYGMVIEKEEAKKKFEERKKVPVEIGKFGDFTLKSLEFWPAAEEPVDGVSIAGDQIRNIVSQTMRTHEVLENQVSVVVEIVMLERNQKFGFWGEDTPIGAVQYFAIPETLPRRPHMKDIELQIVDDKGTLVKIAVSYAENSKLARKKN